MNHVTLVGRITQPLTLRETSTNKHYVFFTVAVNNINNKADYINCIAWNRVAENMTKFVGKGSLISVVGRLTTRKNSNNQNITEVSAVSVSFLDSRKRDFTNENITNSTNSNSSFTENDSEILKNNENNEVSIDEALKNTESYDTEISFVNNNSLNNDDEDDEAIIWD